VAASFLLETPRGGNLAEEFLSPRSIDGSPKYFFAAYKIFFRWFCFGFFFLWGGTVVFVGDAYRYTSR